MTLALGYCSIETGLISNESVGSSLSESTEHNSPDTGSGPQVEDVPECLALRVQDVACHLGISCIYDVENLSELY